VSANAVFNAQGNETPVSAAAEAPLVRWVTCPHCWHRFRPEQVLWVAQHEDLMGDPILGDEPLRFLPTRFTLEGHALDARGMPCHTMACPHCHLAIPRVMLENDTTFLSLIGSVASGKSNLLAAMTWELRQMLARHFAILFADGDKESNYILNRYEETLFLPEDPDRPVYLEKTRTQGDLYRSVRLAGQETQLPKPFIFSLRPTAQHPWASKRERSGAVVCLYDNAGEHYGVGQDTPLTPVTRHLAKAKVLMFLFDPTQDSRFRQRCKAFSRDPQVAEAMHTARQETILSEAALRVRKYLGLPTAKRYHVPLLVLVGKADIWGPLLNEYLGVEPIKPDPAGRNLAVVDMDRVEEVSGRLRSMLLSIAPELVTVAEDFCQDVVYIPVSALGHSPQKQDQTALAVKPRDVRPQWVSVPMLYSFARWGSGLISGSRRGG